MQNRIEQDRRPRQEVFVVSKNQEELLEYFTKHCRFIYGPDLKADIAGNILYRTWHQVKREKVEPEAYSLLSGTREKEQSYLARPLTTKLPYELRINRVRKEKGSVEAGIRSVEHALETELEKERPQMGMVRGRISELFDLFTDFSEVTDEQLEEAVGETHRRLANVGFDPQKVVLEEKERMANWLIKASGGKDSIERKNRLIIMMALEAANRRAVKRERGIGETVSKFVRMREGLRFERAFSREILEEVRERLGPQRMPAHYLFKYPEKPPQNIVIVAGILNTSRWQLTQPHVKPYRPAGMEAGEVLGEVVDLLRENRRGEIVERELFGQARGILEEVLDTHKDIYPK
ncbi:hypothetical protein KKE75_03535 [Patescibacteria group bacterium]|nr:hypothetical protein [Patescibacteria group bacterium]MBU2459104.1 hypothetical protein [Nanoarchaeota archaeon]